MFELLALRLRKSWVPMPFIRSGLRRDVRKMDADETHFKVAEMRFQQAKQSGSVEGVEHALKEETADVFDEQSRIEDMDERALLLIFRVLSKYLVEVEEVMEAEDALQKIAGQFQPSRNISEHELARFRKSLQLIADVFEKDADQIYETLLRLARVMRDEYEGVKSLESHARLRDLMVGVVGQDFQAKWKAFFIGGKIGDVRRDVRKTMGWVEKLQRLVTVESKRQHDEKSFKQVMRLVEDIAKEVVKEDEDIRALLKDTTFILLVGVYHYFKAIGHMLTLNDILEKRKGHFQELERMKFPHKHLEGVEDNFRKGEKRLEKKSLTVMREAYQELRELDGRKRTKIFSKYSSQLGDALKDAQRAAA